MQCALKLLQGKVSINTENLEHTFHNYTLIHKCTATIRELKSKSKRNTRKTFNQENLMKNVKNKNNSLQNPKKEAKITPLNDKLNNRKQINFTLKLALLNICFSPNDLQTFLQPCCYQLGKKENVSYVKHFNSRYTTNDITFILYRVMTESVQWGD